MSDYLWDKTGKADEEVERLEELLSELRHRPRVPELPTEVEADAAHAPRRFRAAWLAIAAALLLAFMAVGFVALRSDEKSSGGQTASQNSRSAPRQSAPQQVRVPKVTASPDITPAPQPESRGIQVASQNPPRKQEARERVERVVAVRPERGFLMIADSGQKEHEGVAVQPIPGGVARNLLYQSWVENAAPQQLAKEQVMYALRLTSFKLKEVRRKTQGIVGSKSAFDERRRVR